MYEVEMKAHVFDRENVINKLNSFADFQGTVQKEDDYWTKIEDGRKIQARIRKETAVDSKDGEKSEKKETIYLTYKRKELRFAAEGTSYEVNDEKEAVVSDPAPLEAFFEDVGLQISLKKQKKVMGWYFGDAHIELCTVPPLGDFLEIEIMSDKNDENTVKMLREKIVSILKKCDITEDKIENKYYSEMLREANAGGI